MNNRNLLIYESIELFRILEEIKDLIHFNIIHLSIKDIPKYNEMDLSNNLIITEEKIPGLGNQLIIEQFPVKITKLLEKINIHFLKSNFSHQSKKKVGKYTIDINSRKMQLGEKFLKLTEKESDMIIYLSKFIEPISINDLQISVWGHHSKLETHTVETHIYRLRKKISKVFDDKEFIISKKNGYKIKK